MAEIPLNSWDGATFFDRDRGLCGLRAPAEDTERPQRVPPAGAIVAVLERRVDFAGMRVFQQPGAIGWQLRCDVTRPPDALGRMGHPAFLS